MTEKEQELYFARNEIHSKTEYIQEQRDIIEQQNQKYNELLEQYKELEDRANRMIEDKYNLGRECEELKEKIKQAKNFKDKVINQLKEENEELKKKNETYKCSTNCHKYIEADRYRKALEEIKEYTRKQFCDNCEDIGSTEYNCHCEYCEYQEYFDIISGFADGRSETSPDSEQIEHTVAEAQMRNSVSVEQIQDSKAKGEL